MSDGYRRTSSKILKLIAVDYNNLDTSINIETELDPLITFDRELAVRLDASSALLSNNPNIPVPVIEIANDLDLLINLLRQFSVSQDLPTARLLFLNDRHENCLWPRKIAVLYFLVWYLCQFLMELGDEDDHETKSTLQGIILECLTAIQNFDEDFKEFKGEVGRLKIILGTGLPSFDSLCLNLVISTGLTIVPQGRTLSEFLFYELSGAFSSLFLNPVCFGKDEDYNKYRIFSAYKATTPFKVYTHATKSSWRHVYSNNTKVDLSGMAGKQGFNHNLLIDKGVTQGIMNLFFPNGLVDMDDGMQPNFDTLKSCFENATLDPTTMAEKDVENVIFSMLKDVSMVANMLTKQLGITCIVVTGDKNDRTGSSYGEHTIRPDWHLVTKLRTNEKVEQQVLAVGETKKPVSGHAIGSLNLGGVLYENDKEEIRRVAEKAERMGFPSCDVNHNVETATDSASETWLQVVAGLSGILDASSKNLASSNKNLATRNYIEANGEVYLITWDGSCLIIAKVPGKDEFFPDERPFESLKPEAVWVATVEEPDIFANVVFFLVNHSFRLLKHKIDNGTVLEPHAYGKFRRLLNYMEENFGGGGAGDPNNNNQGCPVLITPFNNGGEEMLKDAQNRNNTYKEALELTLSRKDKSLLARGKYRTIDDFAVEDCITSEQTNRYTVLLVVRKGQRQQRKSVLKIFPPTHSEAFFKEVTAYISLDDSFPKGSVHRRNFAECYGFGSINWQGSEVYYIELEYISGSEPIRPSDEELVLINSAVESLLASNIVHNDLRGYRNIIIDKTGKRAVIIDFELSAVRPSK